MSAKPIKATRAEKAAAFEWLRDYALRTGDRRAVILLAEVVALNKKVRAQRSTYRKGLLLRTQSVVELRTAMRTALRHAMHTAAAHREIAAVRRILDEALCPVGERNADPS